MKPYAGAAVAPGTRVMPRSSSCNLRRAFAGGWLSDHDPSLMALIWLLSEANDSTAPEYEAEVIRGVEKIASLRAPTVDEIRRALDTTYGAPPEAAPQAPLLLYPPPRGEPAPAPAPEPPA